MRTAIKDLGYHSVRILDAITNAEVVYIKFRGKLCAKLVPCDEEEEVTEIKIETSKILEVDEEPFKKDGKISRYRKGFFVE